MGSLSCKVLSTQSQPSHKLLFSAICCAKSNANQRKLGTHIQQTFLACLPAPSAELGPHLLDNIPHLLGCRENRFIIFCKTPRQERSGSCSKSLEKNNKAQFRTGVDRGKSEKTRSHKLNSENRMKYYLFIKGTSTNLCTEQGRESAGEPKCKSVINYYGLLVMPKVTKLRS